MNAGLLVHGYPVRARLGKLGNKPIGVLDHQMHIKDGISHRPQPFNNRRPNRDVGHKMPIHHVQVNDGCAAFDGGENVIGQVGKIGRENRRCEFDQNTCFPMSGDSHDFIKRAAGSLQIRRFWEANMKN